MVTLTSGRESGDSSPPCRILITQWVPGEMVVAQRPAAMNFSPWARLVEVTGKRVSILTDMAVAADRSTKPVEEARRRAEDRLKEKISTEESLPSTLIDSRWPSACQGVATRPDVRRKEECP